MGRACVNNTSQADTFVNKVLAYEKNPPDGYGDTVFFMGFDADSGTPGEECKKKIKDDCIAGDKTFSSVYDSEPGTHETDVLNALDSGINLVNHIDHGKPDRIGAGSENHGGWVDHLEAQNLTNGTRYTNLYTLACYPG